ncbi:uncharacterized protein LOC131230598 [Magnolia sinica]|uniref:uncharacterized protein LOC131230598 n=1 Tax=Magnolia sinica TaxID=86752 RepID=UPI0026594DEF|nr:uncharacterized protein LOC131230598 [Magnolia sinica]
MVLFQNLTIHEWEVRYIVQNGSSIAVNAGGLNTESDNGVVGKGVAAGGSGSGVDQNWFAQREAALTKFRQKRKERCFEKKVLLDFIRQINDDQGPMEEQRQRYGPSLYNLTNMVLSIRLFLLLSWRHFEARKLFHELAKFDEKK